MLTDDRVAELVQQIFDKEGGYDKAMDRIEYLRDELEDLHCMYDEEMQEEHISAEIKVFWHDIIKQYRVVIEYSNGLTEYPSFNDQGPGWQHTKWKDPATYKRVQIICWIVMLAEKWDRYSAEDLARWLVEAMRQEPIAHSNEAWRYLCWLPKRHFDKATEWLIRKES